MLNIALRNTAEKINAKRSKTEESFLHSFLRSSHKLPQPKANSISVESLSWQEAQAHTGRWSDLITRALDANPFLAPAFVLPAVQHAMRGAEPHFVFVTDHDIKNSSQNLIGLFVLDLPAPGQGSIGRFWQRSYTALGTPLLDCTHAITALDHLFGWLRLYHFHITGLELPMLPAESKTALLLNQYLFANGHDRKVLTQFQRAILSAGEQTDALLHSGSKSKHARNWRRQLRRLEEMGTLSYEVATKSSEMRASMEDFLELEGRGWKGQKKTALIASADTATFTRSMARLLSREGQCTIHALKLNGRAIAMGIVLTSEDQACFWKIAYDEAYAAYSPGIQFVLAFSRHQMTQTNIRMTDSCAIPNHPMIDRIWPERQTMVDVMFSLNSGNNLTFGLAFKREQMRRSMRAMAKTAYYRLLGKKAS